MKVKMLGADHHFVVHALEYDGFNHALQRAVTRRKPMLRSSGRMTTSTGRIRLEALVHALEGLAAELHLEVLEHHAVNDVAISPMKSATKALTGSL